MRRVLCPDLSGSQSPIASWLARRAPERLALVAISETSG
nr:MAG TPA: hypothetical protein [Caudoviricetes sp.]DAI21106.1 MAG TPA: hypothetical protein [Caudoviricetes sp.]